MAYYDEKPLGDERPSGFDHVVDHRDTAQGVQDLRPVRLHPGALARRQDHGEDRRTLRHVLAPLLLFVYPTVAYHALLGWGGRIRTCDPGTKTRCLATWPRPSTGTRRLYRSAFSPSEQVSISKCQGLRRGPEGTPVYRSCSDSLRPAGGRLVDADEGSIDRIIRDPGCFSVVEDAVDCRPATAHRSHQRP